MKFKRLLFGLALLLSYQAVQAQSMTDDQIISYVKQRKDAGATSKTIGNELLSQGATVEQIQNLYSKYKFGTFNPSSSSATAEIEDIDRSNTDNGEKESAEPSTSTKQIFGHDIFRQKLLTFEPNMSMAVAPTYVLGPGDELIVDVYGASHATNKLEIAPDGTANIPRIGPVAVSGLTVEQAQARIRGVMGSHYQNSTIKVSVGQTRTITISVMGEVSTPGNYTLSSFATVFHALYMAGGINDLGTLRDIKVARNGRVITTVDVYEFIISGRLAGNINLKDNDVIIVGAYENLVQVQGNVKRPMWYEMKKNESLKSLFRFCSGFTGDAYTKTVKVNRRAGDMLSIYTVDEFDFTSFKLTDEDIVTIGVNEQRYENIVSVNGAVKRNGDYELASAKTVRGLIELAGGLDESAQTNRAVLTRLNPDRTQKTITVDLAGIINGTTADMKLENEDVLTIASMAAFNDDRTLTISGEVFNPGTSAYADNTTIEDLITKAGGLKVSASLLNVEVSRRIINPEAAKDSVCRSEIFNFTLNKDMTVEGGNNFILKPYDIVTIRRSPAYEEQHTVEVKGQVAFAGSYTLPSNQTRLSDIIKRAGGFKSKASVHNSRLVRKTNDTERMREQQLAEMARDAADSINIADIMADKTYTVGIDLEKAMANPGGQYDVILRDGDQIIVPSHINTVRISGEVLYPNDVTYLEGKNYKYYINEAGGFTEKSVKRRAYIVYANGQVSKLSKGKIEPGCEIVVPVKEDKARDPNELVRWITLGTSVSTAATLIYSILKK